MVDGAEEQEEQQREDEDEERRLAAAPEDELLRAELMDEEPAHGATRSDVDRFGAHASSLLLGGEVEVDLLERRPAHLERLELLAARERCGCQLGEDARRLVRLHDDVLAACAVADLGLEVGRGQLARRAEPHDDPRA